MSSVSLKTVSQARFSSLSSSYQATEALDKAQSAELASNWAELDVVSENYVGSSHTISLTVLSEYGSYSSKKHEDDQTQEADLGYHEVDPISSNRCSLLPEKGNQTQRSSSEYSMSRYIPNTRSEQACISPVGYLQNSATNDAEPMHNCSLDSRQTFGNSQFESRDSGSMQSKASPACPVAPLNPNRMYIRKTKSSADVNICTTRFPLKPHPSTSSSFFSGQTVRPPYKTPQMHTRVHQIVAKGRIQSGRFSAVSKQGQNELFGNNDLTNLMPSVRNIEFSKMRERYGHHRDHDEASRERVCGPRSKRAEHSAVTAPDKNDSLNLIIRRDQFNKPDFQINYEKAKFFMIKSFSEDDIHKGIKYNVWSSTPNGNKKLDDAYQDVEAKFREQGTNCPIFLFFSVNASGQFVGLAEMIGRVDFKKKMDFWQQDRWSGFFPVKWHIIKDIPNRHFQNIILENNDYRPVTFSRDTQEIGLPQGLKMLHMFKSYSEQTSLLEDFEFYETMEKSLYKNKSGKPSFRCSEARFNNNNYTLSDLETTFKNLDVSARSSKAYSNGYSSSGTQRRNFSFGSHQWEHR